MPTILNSYYNGNSNSSLGNALAQLGNSIWGPQAAMAGYAREKARGAARNNAAEEAAMAAARAGNLDMNANPDLRASVIGADNPRALAQGILAIQAGRYGATSPQAASAGVGAGESYGSTGQGYNAGLANQRTIAQMQTDRAMATERYKFDHTLQPTYDPASGHVVLTPTSQAAGAEAPPTKENIVGSVLRQNLQPGGQPPAQVASAQPATAPAATQPAQDPFDAMSPRVQHILGVDVPEQSLIEPRSGQTGISRDGGKTVILPNGLQIPSTGFQPVGQEAALSQARDNNVRANAAQPLVVGDPTKSQAAADAYQATGLAAGAQKFFNEDIGALPGATSVIQAVTGSPEIAPETQRAQSRLEVLAQQARSTLLGATGRQTVAAQKWVDEILPQGHAFANPATAQRDMKTVVDAMAADYEQERQLALSTADPTERARLVQHMHQIQNTIELFTRPPAQQTTPQAAAPAQAPAAAPAAQPKVTPQDAAAQARDAIARGANPGAVRQRLQQMGVDPAGAGL